MTKVEYQTQINAPVKRVYEYYTDPNNTQKTWPQDIVKESQAKSDSKNEEGSEMRVGCVETITNIIRLVSLCML